MICYSPCWSSWHIQWTH